MGIFKKIFGTYSSRQIKKIKKIANRIEALAPQYEAMSNEELAALSAKNDLILYAIWIGAHEPMGGMHLYGEECHTYLWAFSSGKEKSIGVSMGYPYVHYDLLENADTFINTYGQSPQLMKALVEAIFGEIPFVAEAPIQVEPDPLDPFNWKR